MRIKEKLQAFYETVEEKCFQQFGFCIKDITLTKVVDYMYAPKDSSSLAVTRILFGLAMLFDIPDERGGATMDKRWGDPKTCHFPLLPFIQAVRMPYMALVYLAMWIGALGITLGYKYRMTATMFTVCHWYLLLIEKSYWNNHSYLFGLVAVLLSFTEANCYWSLDAYLNPSKMKTTVPYWNYFILKYQFFILYFMAGMKKGTAEWLSGYSVRNLSEHWVFAPFRLFLTVPQTDYLIVHWLTFVFDLTIAFWMMWSYTRHVAMVFCAIFHLMNSRLFKIGMFPWVCLGTMPLFYPFDWPKIVIRHCERYNKKIRKGFYKKFIIAYQTNEACECKLNESFEEKEKLANLLDDKNIDNFNQDVIDNQKTNDEINEGNTIDKDVEQKSSGEVKRVGTNHNDTEKLKQNITNTQRRQERNEKSKTITMYLIFFHVLSQAFLPYSHFITKGFNNWTNGLYGYSWDMMVHTWDLHSVVVKVVDNDNNKEFYVDPNVYAPNDRWTRHGDMVLQYAKCLKENLMEESKARLDEKEVLSQNISIYVDVWYSMNGRFVQRVVDPKVDLLNASWSLFRNVSFLMPLVVEGLEWRKGLEAIREDVNSWNNYSDVVFFADFPGYYQETYIPIELNNVTLTVLEGLVAYEPEVSKLQCRQSYRLTSANHIKVEPEHFHKVMNIGNIPAFYMYTFRNSTHFINEIKEYKSKLPVHEELYRRINDMLVFATLIASHVFELIFEFVSTCD